jgi:hypothetical protein
MRITIETDEGAKVVQSSDSPQAGAAIDAGAAGAPRTLSRTTSGAQGGAAMDGGAPPDDLVHQVERARLMDPGAPASDSRKSGSAKDAGAGPRIQ